MNDITIHGTVRGPAGGAIGSAMLTLISPQGQQLGRARTGADGSYRLTVPSPGAYVLITAADGHQPKATAVVAEGTAVAHDVVLMDTSGLAGVVRGSSGGLPVVGAMVVVTDPHGEVLASAKTDENGAFTFEDLPVGTFTLAVNAHGYRPSAIPVEVGGQGMTRIEVGLSTGVRLQGTVRAGAHRRPLRDARVTLVDARGEVVATATTGEDGRYAFTDLEADDYTLIAGGYPPKATPLTVNGRGQSGYDVELGHPDE
jgi:uncharacterized protein YfaS (alpha-2-macroglobulin family)